MAALPRFSTEERSFSSSSSSVFSSIETRIDAFGDGLVGPDSDHGRDVGDLMVW